MWDQTYHHIGQSPFPGIPLKGESTKANKCQLTVLDIASIVPLRDAVLDIASLNPLWVAVLDIASIVPLWVAVLDITRMFPYGLLY